MKKLKIHFRLTRGWELFFIFVMLASLMALFQETSILRGANPLAWRPHLIGTIDFSGLWALWITVIVFHIALFIVIARSVIVEGRNKTSNWLDYSFGFLSVLSIYCILISTIYWINRGLPNIEFLWNISSLLLLRIGFVTNFLVALYFGVTE